MNVVIVVDERASAKVKVKINENESERKWKETPIENVYRRKCVRMYCTGKLPNPQQT